MTEVESQTGWWQASDGNWYPPESSPTLTPQSEPARRPSWFEKNRTRVMVGALMVLILGGFTAATLSFRSSADKWQTREHDQHSRADSLQSDLDTARAEARDTKNQLDVATCDLTGVRAWSKEADTALKAYTTCIDDINALSDKIADAYATGNVSGLE